MESLLPDIGYLFAGIAVVSGVLAIVAAVWSLHLQQQPQLPELHLSGDMPLLYMDWHVVFQVVCQYQGEEVWSQSGNYYVQELTRTGFEQAWSAKAYSLFANHCLYREPIYFEVIGIVAHPALYRGEEFRNKFRGPRTED
jgi:hypothetical protein